MHNVFNNKVLLLILGILYCFGSYSECSNKQLRVRLFLFGIVCCFQHGWGLRTDRNTEKWAQAGWSPSDGVVPTRQQPETLVCFLCTLQEEGLASFCRRLVWGAVSDWSHQQGGFGQLYLDTSNSPLKSFRLVLEEGFSFLLWALPRGWLCHCHESEASGSLPWLCPCQTVHIHSGLHLLFPTHSFKALLLSPLMGFLLLYSSCESIITPLDLLRPVTKPT